MPAPSPPAARATLPDACGEAGAPCFPPVRFVELLCRDKFPDVALFMFKKSAPWQHAFVKVRDVMARNFYGGPTGDPRLVFSEEMILLRHRPTAATGIIQERPPDHYDVLRLDGTCADLAEDELRLRWAGPSAYAPITWNLLAEGTRGALSESERVERARKSQAQRCRGSYLGGGGADCQRATQKLATVIVDELDQGRALPTPERIPDWSAERD